MCLWCCWKDLDEQDLIHIDITRSHINNDEVLGTI
jgi:hypothetical protein